MQERGEDLRSGIIRCMRSSRKIEKFWNLNYQSLGMMLNGWCSKMLVMVGNCFLCNEGHPCDTIDFSGEVAAVQKFCETDNTCDLRLSVHEL